MLLWIVYSVVGRIIIFLWEKLYLPEKLEKNKFIAKLHSCGLCSGTYIYSGLAFFIHVNLLYVLFGTSYIPILEELISGMITSFVVHVFVLGWHSMTEVVII